MENGNRLRGEHSPYLLMHVQDPVDWYPWGDDAFAKAQELDRPIFLSIGYMACHWCHVMERESFSDLETAALLNDTFISIKVDREERPDIDALFMEVCSIQNGSGGWPLNIFLTPDGEPFFAATYLPKRTAGKLPGLTDVAPRIKWLWHMQRESVLKGASSIVKTFDEKLTFKANGPLRPVHVKSVFRELKKTFDRTYGGFGEAQKFPCAPRLIALLEFARATPGDKSKEALRMVELTLHSMWKGGIHDHLGGGYARYTVDRRWQSPHFEKMLYDQAILLWVAALAFEITGFEFYRRFAEDIVTYIQRDFMSLEGAFWSSLDADSEGIEGRYYLWTEEEIRAALPNGESGIFCAAYSVSPGGNCHEKSGGQMGANILRERDSLAETAQACGIPSDELVARLQRDREILLKARMSRTSPAVDDKVVMEWNGLTLGALALAGRVFDRADWLASAKRAAAFLCEKLAGPRGWKRCLRGQSAYIDALPGDYAAMMWGLMQLHAADHDGQWLTAAAELSAAMTERFWDGDNGGLYLSAADEPHLFYRRKAADDDAIPSANALAVMAWQMMERAETSGRYRQLASATAAAFSRIAALAPAEHASLIMATQGL